MKTPLQAAHDLLHVMTEVGGVMAHNYCNCGDNKGSCIDCAEEEIGRLKAELEEASTIANDNYQVILKCNAQINDYKRQLDASQALLAEAKHSYEVLKITYTNLEKTHYETTYDRVQRLESQLAEARAEVEALTDCLNGSSKATYTAEMFDTQLDKKVAEARQEAARECLLLFYLALDESISFEETYIKGVKSIKAKFGLEG